MALPYARKDESLTSKAEDFITSVNLIFHPVGHSPIQTHAWLHHCIVPGFPISSCVPIIRFPFINLDFVILNSNPTLSTLPKRELTNWEADKIIIKVKLKLKQEIGLVAGH